MPGRPCAFGEAEGYRRFLASDVLPYIGAHYRADMAQATFVGHSYGGLLGAHILLTAPQNAEVFFSVGALEAAGDNDMVADLKKFDRVLRSRRCPHLKTQVHVWRGKDHLDVFPEMITAALKWAIPRSR